MSFKAEKLKNNNGDFVDGPLLIIPKLFKDHRGHFMESWNKDDFNSLLKREIDFVQDNQSKSIKGVLRGLHFQLSPFEQAKLVRCINGKVFDVAVDIRKNSLTFGTWIGMFLSSKNNNQFWIPEGFAHGFLTISKVAEIHYKTTSFWSKNHERALNWADKSINIKWPLNDENIIISNKDSKAPFLNDCLSSLYK